MIILLYPAASICWQFIPVYDVILHACGSFKLHLQHRLQLIPATATAFLVACSYTCKLRDQFAAVCSIFKNWFREILVQVVNQCTESPIPKRDYLNCSRKNPRRIREQFANKPNNSKSFSRGSFAVREQIYLTSSSSYIESSINSLAGWNIYLQRRSLLCSRSRFSRFSRGLHRERVFELLLSSRDPFIDSLDWNSLQLLT